MAKARSGWDSASFKRHKFTLDYFLIYSDWFEVPYFVAEEFTGWSLTSKEIKAFPNLVRLQSKSRQRFKLTFRMAYSLESFEINLGGMTEQTPP